ncbi:Probable DNA repair protein [Neorhizobium galegae bv. officinalis bv. officinalis str. HAMBI 1141]|uniref:Non-homologous end joining protein Ku n=1 Tax=Neorhizobium galegae bv. officinalis bv. officinalis str. HAMBI 1141 TaxID=1028801 RepID=A0A068TBW8_NEOGA|nr:MULTISPECIES: Ku protein [Neorhizobium]MCJ9669231.1 Ku protein [Neorhizobium sp. SHOUNA12B]MCJ9742905.1 Ku protein [Neorhizobium sp. SHOUNA12A]CDN55561.1 Probable DNA repair protein [Neorhizobium galegae bv. officinalis bv. officinalis str. HAMBI 1141]
MAPRVFWKGYLKLSLVTCRVTMTPAVSEGAKVRFHNINRKTNNRVLSQYVDAQTGEAVEDDDQVKGYPKGEDDYVLLEDEEIEDVGLESTRTIDIETFVPADSIGWIWYDRPHYLAPDDEVSAEAFAVIREAMAKTNTGGIARLVMYRRERAVLLLPKDKGIVVWTLRYGDEVRDAGEYAAEKPKESAGSEHLAMMKKIIDERTQAWKPSMADDPVQDRLLEIIAERKKSRKSRKKVEEKGPERSSNVIDITAALKKSLEAERKAPRK